MFLISKYIHDVLAIHRQSERFYIIKYDFVILDILLSGLPILFDAHLCPLNHVYV